MRKLGERKECNKKIDERDGATQSTDYGHPMISINQRYLKIWADVADKICFGRI